MKNCVMRVYVFILISFLLTSITFSQELPDGSGGFPTHIGEISESPIIPVKATTPPEIDGILNDAIWAAAHKFTGFKTFKPDYGKDASEKSEAFIAYDKDNLYFAMQCFDSEPELIKASITKRDNMFDEDNVIFVLDKFGDHQNEYAFFLNPYGIQGDIMINSMGDGDPSVDIIWYSKGVIHEKGYTVEAKVPFKSILKQVSLLSM